MRRSVVRSTTFARVLRAFGIFVLIALGVLWALTLLWRANLASTEWQLLEAEVAWIEADITENGIEDFLDAYAGDERIWEDDFLYEPLEEGSFIYAFRDEEDELLAGYGDLYPTDLKAGAELFHPEIDVPIRGVKFGYDGGYAVTARFEPDERSDILAFAQFGTFALFLIGLPLALFVGYFLSRDVLRRIEVISATTAAIAEGDMARRAPETGQNDEFDRLAGGINHMLGALAQLNANIEAVSVGVAHDLKTPLANIGGRLELMERDAGDPAALQGHIEAAQDYLDELLRIFEALLRLGEVESGRRKAAFAPLDLSEIVANMGEAYAPVFEDAQKSLEVSVAPGVALDGDRELLEQMLSNLLENALEHSRDAAQVQLTLSASALTIGDDGPGIPPAHHSRIFERFYRADSSRTNPGSGLGLALVKSIADLHAMTITLDTRAKGAVFSIALPPSQG
ncbi:MAG: HAMP domain-containing histidine kinase [Rhodobacteraceae bacterium]|nr:HAMP domain-containing histidine kinase [Paracoccaceae bacterium]